MGDPCQTLDVYHIRVGVAQSLDVESLGVLLKACFDLIIIGSSPPEYAPADCRCRRKYYLQK